MADALKDRIRADLNDARRSKDRLRITVLTTVLSDIRNKEIELGRDATDDDVVGVVTRAIKQRAEAAEQMREAGGRGPVHCAGADRLGRRQHGRGHGIAHAPDQGSVRGPGGEPDRAGRAELSRGSA